jgi:hypothetical protein
VSVIEHKTTEFKPDEIDGCIEALHLCEAVDLVQVVEHGGRRGVRLDPPRGGVKKGLVARRVRKFGRAVRSGDLQRVRANESTVQRYL